MIFSRRSISLKLDKNSLIKDNSTKNTLYYNYEEIDYYKNSYLISY